MQGIWRIKTNKDVVTQSYVERGEFWGRDVKHKSHTKPLVPGVPLYIEWDFLCIESLLSWDRKETPKQEFVQCKLELLLRTETVYLS